MRHQTELARAREAELVKTRELAGAREQELAHAAQLAAAKTPPWHMPRSWPSPKKRVRVLRRFSAVTLAFAVVALLSYRKPARLAINNRLTGVLLGVSEARDQLETRPHMGCCWQCRR